MQTIRTSLMLVSWFLVAHASIIDLLPGMKNKIPDLGNPRWGNAPDNNIIEPFQIEYSNNDWNNLKDYLEKATIAPSMEATDFTYGFQSEAAKDMVEFWKSEYNYTERLEYLNQYPQYKTNVDGLSLHYIHIKPEEKWIKNKRVVPILMLHGFPGSVREFYDVIALIKQKQEMEGNPLDYVLEMVIPSLPGFGFSQGADRPGMGAAQIAVVLKNLMVKLGHEQFIVHGGDWGARIVTLMSTLFPKNVIGFHSNFCVALTKESIQLMLTGAIYPRLVVSDELQDRMYPIKDKLLYALQETGFFHEQMTKPDTIGIALSDSPLGLAAWIIEKFTGLTDPKMLQCKDGCLKTKFGWTKLLDNLLYYHVPNSISTAVRIYKESFTAEQFALDLDNIPSEVRSACVAYRYESLYMTKRMVQSKFPKLVHYETKNVGGHFAAFEVPEIFVADLLQAVGTLIDLKQKPFFIAPLNLPTNLKTVEILQQVFGKIF